MFPWKTDSPTGGIMGDLAGGGTSAGPIGGIMGDLAGGGKAILIG